MWFRTFFYFGYAREGILVSINPTRRMLVSHTSFFGKYTNFATVNDPTGYCEVVFVSKLNFSETSV